MPTSKTNDCFAIVRFVLSEFADRNVLTLEQRKADTEMFEKGFAVARNDNVAGCFDKLVIGDTIRKQKTYGDISTTDVFWGKIAGLIAYLGYDETRVSIPVYGGKKMTVAELAEHIAAKLDSEEE